jgi:hypothetical protein
VPTRGPFVRVLLGVGVVPAAALALIGGVALRGSGVVAVLLAGAVAACLAAGVARETAGSSRTRAPEAAVQAAGWAIGSLLVLAGTAALGGGLAAVLTGAAGAIVGLAVWLVRSPRPSREVSPHTLTADVTGARPTPAAMPAAPWHAAPGGRSDAAGSARLSAPVTDLPTAALGHEWLRTTAALAGRLEPVARESIVRRRQEALDELERRDADGFARWLAAGPAPGSDPADFVHGGPAGGREGEHHRP